MKKNMKMMIVTLLASTMALAPLHTIQAQETHTVQKGEWLLKIARENGVSLSDLKEWNGISGEWIDSGQVLYLEDPNSGTVSPSPAAPVGDGTYVVQAGDTLYTIASAVGISVESLMANNGLSSTWINVGDVLNLSGGGSSPSLPVTPVAPSTTGYHIVQPGDTLSYIAIANGISVEYLMAINGLSSTWLNVGDKLALSGTAPAPSYSDITYTENWGSYHTVQAGETLWDIANAYGTTYEAIMASNGLSSSYLNVGDQLLVPGYYETVVAEDYSSPSPTNNEVSPETNTEKDKEKDKDKDTEKDKEKEDKDKFDAKQDLRDLSKEELEEIYEDLPEIARPRKHKVADGESLASIGETYNFSVNSLKEWNDLTGDEVTVGDEIYVSNPRYIPEVYEVAAGDSLDSIARQFDISTSQLDRWNQLDGSAPSVGDDILVADPTPRQHEVQPREKLDDIAKKYGITKDQLVEWNNLPETVQFFNGTLAVVDPDGVDFDKDSSSEDVENSNETEASEAEETSAQ